jgi:hypothetical protein
MHLRAFVLCFLVIKVATISSAESPQVSCESISIGYWPIYGTSSKSMQTCFIQTFKIDSRDFVLGNGRNETIKGLWFPGNKKVEFLPTKVLSVFPNLEAFSAPRCSIREISKENFVGLSKLEYLSLSGNQIKTVRSGTFEGLSSLTTVWLSKFDFVADNNLVV